MQTLGTSVGNWNTNSQEKFLNVSGKPFYKSRLNFKTAMSQLGININEYRKRGAIYKDLQDNLSLSDFQINSFYNDWQVRGNTGSEGFKDFILNQLLLQRARLEEENQKLQELKEKEESEIISDSNLFPPKAIFDEDALPNLTNQLPKKKSNLPLYIGVGGGIILIGALLVYKFR